MLAAQGYCRVAGVDEVGRGPLAGPVVAAAVILPSDFDATWLGLVRDSKQLTGLTREFLYRHILEAALSVSVGMCDSRTIDRRGIVAATRLAMKSAVDQLQPPAESLLIDYMTLPDIRLPQKPITHGDGLCLSIACASIVAKVTRDHLMVEVDDAYPGYGFRKHKGYGTPEHFTCLRRLGPCPVHRRSFRPVRDMV
ncbi:MAG: ribonuclease HII [Dehalococcoidales bacterium]|nr:MAG: ribonuclease HII [Dehalococcoidales bacterium]